MSDVTQLTDEYLFDKATAATEAPIKISKGKSVVSVIDLNQGSYTNGTVTIDATNQLNGANGFASLSEAYITVPYVVSLNTNGTTGIADNKGITQFIGALKANTATIVDRIQVEMDGKTLITPTSYLSHWNNFRALTEWSDADVKAHGSSTLMYPDDTHSATHNLVQSNGGDGYINNYMTSSTNIQGDVGITGAFKYAPKIAQNAGFVKRALFNPPVVSTQGTDRNTQNWPSLAAGSNKQHVVSSGKGATILGSATAAGNIVTYCYMLRIRLKDLHPIFSTFDYLANPSLKLTLFINTGSCTIDVSSTAMKVGSVNMTQGSVCPFMVSSASTGYPMAGVLSAGTPTLTLQWGVMSTPNAPVSTTSQYYPYTTCRMFIPFYDLNAEKQLEIVKHPKKVYRYLDVFTQTAKNLTGNAISTTGTLNSNFNIQVSGNQKNVKYVALQSYASTSAAGLNFASATNIEQGMSPFDSAPMTQQFGSNVINFNVQVGNQNVFNNPVSYDFNGFLDEWSKISSLYGGQDHRLACGLLDAEKWSNGYRTMIADVSRLTDKNVSQSIMISGTNNCSQPSDYLVFVAYEKAVTIDRITGSVELM